MKHLIFLALFLSVSIFSCSQLAQISGKVIDKSTSRPIGEAVVHINHCPVRILTDDSGNFSLPNVPVGRIEFTVASDGYDPYTLLVDVKPKVYVINVSLESRIQKPLPPLLQELNLYREKIGVVTDKPYYYPREIIWFKVFLNYIDRTKKDSLSRVVYVDLISQSNKVISHHVLSLDSGEFKGNIILSNDLEPGNYLMRAYTRFMINFGEDQFFYKSIPVLPEKSFVTLSNFPVFHNEKNFGIEIQKDKAKYGTRNKVNLVLGSSIAGNPLPDGDYTISVTDMAQVVGLTETNLSSSLRFEKDLSQISPVGLDNIVEKGIQCKGTFVNQYNAGKQVKLTAYREDYTSVLNFDTDEKGRFQINGVKFYDSAEYFYKATKKKSEFFGKIVLEKPIDPSTDNLVVPGFWFGVEDATSIQRALVDYLVPPETKMLDEVEIKSTKLESSAISKGIAGGADKVINAFQLTNYGNILLSLQGKVPGLQINCANNPCTVFFSRAIGSSALGSIEPLLLINDIPAFGRPGETLQNIDVNMVERIEFSKRINVRYGEQGKNGIIAIYLKDGVNRFSAPNDVKSKFTLKGFDRPLKFVSPDYSDANQESRFTDQRSTIYWNPKLRKDARGNYSCSFFTSDMEGSYRVIVQGVNNQGDVIKGVSIITVN